jgi:hypothetical protein
MRSEVRISGGTGNLQMMALQSSPKKLSLSSLPVLCFRVFLAERRGCHYSNRTLALSMAAPELHKWKINLPTTRHSPYLA